jgi:streptogramin lyase
VAFGPDGYLYVVSEGTGAIIRYDPISGTALGTFAVVPGSGNRVPIDLTFGPNFDLYVSSQLPNSEIFRFNGATGELIGTFASGGGLFFPTQFAFGPDGSLYVNSLGTDSVLRYSGSTGAFLGVFAQGQGLNETAGDNAGLAFGPGGELFVSNAFADNIVRFTGATGAYDGVLVSSGAGGLDNPTWLTVRPVPEPAALPLLFTALLILVGFRTTSNFGLQRSRISGVAAVASR